MFVHVESQSQKYFVKGCFFATESGHGDLDVDTSPMDTYGFFGIKTVYDLVEEGISYEAVKNLIPQLYQHYDTGLKPWVKSHKRFFKDWERRINDFIECRGIW